MRQSIIALLCILLGVPSVVIADNKLIIQPFSIKAGETKEMVIYLENDKDITLVQFDMMLPDGLTIPVDADDELLIAIAGRTTTNKHSLDASAIGGGYRFLLASMKNSVLTGTEGAIIAITLVAASYFNGGTITLKEIELVSPDETAVYPVPISIEVNTTPAAIKNTVFKNGPQTFYDLLGRKVNDIKKGIWVTEGHKAVK